MKRRILRSVVIFIPLICLLSGCTLFNEYIQNTSGSYSVQELLSETQIHCIIIGEVFLLVLLILLFILTIVLFSRYRKTKKREMESVIRERALVKENEALDSLNRMKTEFFQDMSHDFKTPLTVISTSVLNAMDILDFEIDKDEIRESLKLAQSEIMRISRIVDNALKHALLNENQKGTELVDIEKLLQRVTHTYTAFLSQNGNTLLVSIQENAPKIHVNTDMLLNIFSNLLSNSNRYTKNGEISIHASVTEESTENAGNRKFFNVTVNDTGAGVSPEILPNIFTRGASESGSGLGLSICKTAIESLGGIISVESEEGEGTKVNFTIPVYSETMD